ncbi:MAG: BolA family transcriptional regulator [Candidatus Omnitrophica bacterium]|nr:BolA family transcriptional regulator [Candidatus Omnitrophota bacterium]
MKAKIEKILRERFQPQFLQVIDQSPQHAGHVGAQQGGHFTVQIVSKVFEGKTLLDRHRMVYEALKELRSHIHALAIRAKTPPEPAG